MRNIVRLLAITLLFAQYALAFASASEVASDQLLVPNARILSFSPDGRWLLASHPVPPEAGSIGSTRAMIQDDEVDEDEPKLCVYAVPSLVPRSCSAPGVFRGDNGPNLIDGTVSWSPDSESLVFGDGSLQVFLDGDIWNLDASTGELTNLTDDGFEGDVPFDYAGTSPVYIDLQPSYSPDGTSIVFSRTTFVKEARAVPSVARLNLETGVVSTIATLPADPLGLISGRILWSGEGSRVFWTTSGLEESTVALWSAAVDGSSITQITEPFTERGSDIWLLEINGAGDSAIVAFTRAIQRIKPPYYAMVDLKSGAVTALSPSDSSVFVYSVTFAKDGTVLMAEELPGEGDAEDTVRLLSFDPATGEATLLGEGLPEFEFNPARTGLTLLPDDLVAYPNSRDGDDFSWTLVSLTGVDPVPVTPESAGAFKPGDTVVTTEATVLRTTPASGSAIAAALDAGTELVVIDAAVEVDGIVWWPVREPKTGALGYVPAALIEAESS